MTEDIIKEAIVYSAGKPVEGITEIFSAKKYVNEFLVAKKMGITINQTRNILYKLSDSGLVSSIRKKDKKKGWFTYFWKIEILKSLEFLSQILLKQDEQVNNQIKSRESKQFYICGRCNIELTEEKALLQDFICTECGEVFKMKDNSKFLKELKKNLEKIKNKLSFVNKEIEKEKEKTEKQKIKENEKLAKKPKIKKVSKEKKKSGNQNRHDSAKQVRVVSKIKSLEKIKRLLPSVAVVSMVDLKKKSKKFKKIKKKKKIKKEGK